MVKRPSKLAGNFLLKSIRKRQRISEFRDSKILTLTQRPSRRVCKLSVEGILQAFDQRMSAESADSVVFIDRSIEGSVHRSIDRMPDVRRYV